MTQRKLDFKQLFLRQATAPSMSLGAEPDNFNHENAGETTSTTPIWNISASMAKSYLQEGQSANSYTRTHTIEEGNSSQWGERLSSLESRLAMLEQQQTLHIPVNTLAPHPYKLKKPFEIVVYPAVQGFIASQFDVSISSSGDTPTEAFNNAKSLILDTYDMLSDLSKDQLGPIPTHQLYVLQDFMEQQ